MRLVSPKTETGSAQVPKVRGEMSSLFCRLAMDHLLVVGKGNLGWTICWLLLEKQAIMGHEIVVFNLVCLSLYLLSAVLYTCICICVFVNCI